MKKISVLLVLLVACVASTFAAETTINRMVLKAVREFNAISVAGEVTVELRYNPEKAGYIVFHYNKNEDKNIRCYNDGDLLVVSGTSDGLRSRIVVFYDKPLKSLEHNGSARLVSRNVVCNPKEFNIVVNGSGDVKLGRVNTKNAKLVINNEGSIYIRKVSIDNVQTEINGSGELIMQEGADLINK